MTPAEIAKELGKARGAVRAVLFRMWQDGHIGKVGRGQYTLLNAEKGQNKEDEAAS